MLNDRKTVTVLFADVVGSTVMGSRNDPELVRGFMAQYFARLSTVAELHGGTVEKFIGDAVMVVFGVPLVHEDDAERAVRAALLMREAVSDLEHELGVGLAVRIAVNTGEVVAGADEGRQFLVTGDVVNVAARLQQGADSGEVVVGASTERLTREVIGYEPRAPIAAKGKVEPITAYRALLARSVVPEQHRGMPELRAELVDREPDLSVLLDSFERAAQDRTVHLVTILGNAGVGKSRLVGEVLGRIAQGSDVRVLKGRCLPYGAGITYWPLMDLVRGDVGIEMSDDGHTAKMKVDRRLAELLDADMRDAVRSRISLLLGLDAVGTALPGIAPERVGVELSWGIRQYLEAVAARGPLVLWIDDLQWAEPAAVEIIRQLMDEAQDVPLLLICVARPELLERLPNWSGARPNAAIIALEPLSATDTRTLLSRLLGVDQLPPVVRSEVAERSAGNALFCEEFLRMLIEEGDLEFADGRWQAVSDMLHLRLPDTIQSIVAARIDALPSGEKLALQTASVMGERFTVDQLLALLESAGAAPESLIRKGFLERDREDRSGRAIRFRHLLIRDVAYDSLSKLDRAALHDRFAVDLESEMADRLDEFSEVLAYHAVQSFVFSEQLRLEATLSARAQRALRWSRAAADRALALYATEQAAGHYSMAIRIALRQEADTDLLRELYDRCGRAFELHGEHGRAIATYEEMDSLGEQRGDERMRADALVHQGTLYTTPTKYCDPDRGDALLEKALRIARSLDDPQLVAQVQRDRIHIELWRGRVDQAIEAGEGSLAAARRIDSPEQLAYTLNTIACCYREAGWIDKGRQALAEAGAIFRERDNKPMLGNVSSQLAGLEFVRGEYQSALRLCAEARGLTEESGNLWGQAFSQWVAGWVHFEHGDLGEAIRVGEDGLRLAESGGLATLLSFWRADLGFCYRFAGADDLADDHLRAAHAFTESRLPHWRAWTLAHLSRAATAHGELGEARRFLELTREPLAQRSEFFAFQHAHVGLASVELLLASGRYPEAAAGARTGGDAQRTLMRPYVADFEHLEGEAHRLSGSYADAARAFDRATETASALDCGRLLWQIAASRATLEDIRGDSAAADRARDDACRGAEAIAESLRPAGLAERFLARPDVAALLRGHAKLDES